MPQQATLVMCRELGITEGFQSIKTVEIMNLRNSFTAHSPNRGRGKISIVSSFPDTPCVLAEWKDIRQIILVGTSHYRQIFSDCLVTGVEPR